MGLGLPRDLHLAKRYYDMALETEPDSYLAVYLALTSLAYGFFEEWYQNGGFTSLIGIEWDTLLILISLLVLIILLAIKHARQQNPR